MNTLKMLFAAMLTIILTAATALAGQSHKTGYPAKTMIYEVVVPENVNDPSVVVEEVAGEYSECEGTPVLSKYVNFILAVSTPRLNKWNFNTASLSGIGGEGSNGRFANLNGHLSFEPGMTYITFAGQYCRQEAAQNYNTEAQQWECVVATEFSCYDVEYYLKGELVLTIEPYSKVR